MAVQAYQSPPMWWQEARSTIALTGEVARGAELLPRQLDAANPTILRPYFDLTKSTTARCVPGSLSKPPWVLLATGGKVGSCG